MSSQSSYKRGRSQDSTMSSQPYKRTRFNKRSYAKSAKSGQNKRFAKVDKGPERKRSDNSFNQTPTRAPGDVYALNVMAQGTDNTNRIGRQILLKSFHYKFNWSCTGSNLATVAAYANGSNSLRIAIVYDKQTNQNLPAIDDIWQLGVSVNNNAFLLRNLDNYDRFIILADDMHVISTAGPNAVTIEKYGTISLPTRYDGIGGTINDVTTGGLYLVVLDMNNTISNRSVLTGMTRVSFTDV